MSYQRWKMVASTMSNIDLTLFKLWTPIQYRYCATLKVQPRTLFHFQCRINVISTVIHNAETPVIRCWNGGCVVSMKKLILRNILPAILLAKWNLWVFFEDYAKTFTTPVFLFDEFLFVAPSEIRLRLVNSSSSGCLLILKIITTWISFCGCQDASENFLFFT